MSSILFIPKILANVVPQQFYLYLNDNILLYVSDSACCFSYYTDGNETIVIIFANSIVDSFSRRIELVALFVVFAA